MRRSLTVTPKMLFACALSASAVLVGCSKSEDGGSSSPTSKPMADYCSASKVYTAPNKITVSGKAFYQYRYMGNGSVSTGTVTFRPNPSVAASGTYSLQINGTTFTTSGKATRNLAAADLASQITASAAVNGIVTATVASDAWQSGTLNQALKLELVDPKVWPTYSAVTNLIQDGGNPNPIRYAEVRALDSSGAVVQCGETQSDGSFSIDLPKDGATYTISVTSRASNSQNSAYVMTNPTDNEFYSLSSAVTASADVSDLWLEAPATGTLEGGAFNIMDQILNAQSYIRTQTASCDSTYSTCTPFTVAPIVYVYWTPGMSPGKYFGITGGISFYLNGKRELYLLGGLNGDTTVTDMDHFDNSVIIHEYGHFIEDQFGKPNSPGGSHNGNNIIDPRLAWGEGWSDFFQAAVTGYPYYRDTKGSVDCSTTNPAGCSSTSFNEPLNTQHLDVPTATGEGNFREFSVARILYSALQSPTSAPFSEIWTVMNGTGTSMKVVSDPFKSIGRFHAIQRAIGSPAKDWSTIRTDEMQAGDLSVYGRTFTLVDGSCAQSPVSMAAQKDGSDDGSFAKSDQLRNNDFYRYDHAGGTVTLTLTYDKPASLYGDLDLYIYKDGYTYGKGSDMAAYSNSDQDRSSTDATKGVETINVSLPAGIYMINVMAYTGVRAATTNYTLTMNGKTLCPDP